MNFISKSVEGSYWSKIVMGHSSLRASSWTEDTNEEPTFNQLNLSVMIESLVEQKVREKIDEIIEKRQTFEFKDVNTKEAQLLVTNFIAQKHKKGIFEISLLDMVLGLKLPPAQVEAVMNGFIKNKKVKEL